MTYALITKNLALNKVAQALAYVERELVCHQSQVRLRPPAFADDACGQWYYAALSLSADF